jgi:hypothetical protein
MTEKFYCVGCKDHYELDVLETVKKPSKGGSFRYSIVGKCPKGHKTTRICKQVVYDSYNAETDWGKPTMKGFVCACGEECSCDCGCAESGVCSCGLIACACDCGCSGVSLEAESPLEAGPSPAGPPADPQPPGPSADPHPREDFPATNEFEAELTPEDRKEIMKKYGRKAFVFPDELGWPIEDKARAKTALVFAEWPQNKAKAAKVRKAVHARYPSLAAESFEANEVVGTMTPGVNLEAIRPIEGGLEDGYGPSLVPEGSFQPEGDGHVIGSQSTSHNYTPMHAETFASTDWDEEAFYVGFIEGFFAGDWDDEDYERVLLASRLETPMRGGEWWMSLNDDEKHTVLDGPAGGAVEEIYEDFVNSYDYQPFEDEWDEDEDEEYASESFFSNNKAKIATAAAALVIGLVYWNSRKTQ